MADTALIRDSFIDADGTNIENHTPEIGGAWSASFNDFKIYSNRCRAQALALQSTVNSTQSTTTPNIVYIQSKVYLAALGRVYMQINDDVNGGSAGVARIYTNKIELYGPLNISELNPYTPVSGATYRLEKNGTTYTLYENGVSILTETAYNGASYAAFNFSMSVSGTEIDDFEAGEIAPEPPTAPSNLTATCVKPKAPVADFTFSPETGQAPLTVNFTDASINTPTSWLWEIDGSEYTTQNCAHDFIAAGTYTARLTATNAIGSHTIEKKITITDYAVLAPPNGGIAGNWIQASNGNNYVVDTVNDRVLIYNASWVYQGYFGGHGSTDGLFDGLTGLVELDGFLFAVDSNNNRIQKFSLAGAYVSQFGSDILNAPYGIAENGVYLYVTDRNNNRIVIYNSSGTKISEFSTGDAVPYGIAVDNHFIYVAAFNQARILVYTLSGDLVHSAMDIDNLTAPTDLRIAANWLIVGDAGQEISYLLNANIGQGLVEETLTIIRSINGE